MFLAQVTGSVVATQKTASMTGHNDAVYSVAFHPQLDRAEGEASRPASLQPNTSLQMRTEAMTPTRSAVRPAATA